MCYVIFAINVCSSIFIISVIVYILFYTLKKNKVNFNNRRCGLYRNAVAHFLIDQVEVATIDNLSTGDKMVKKAIL